LSNTKSKSSPFQILDISPSADKKEILKQVTLALKKRHYDAKTITQAQKLLFNPVNKAVEEFLYYILSDTTADINTKDINKQEHIIGTSYPIPELLNFNNEKTTT